MSTNPLMPTFFDMNKLEDGHIPTRTSTIHLTNILHHIEVHHQSRSICRQNRGARSLKYATILFNQPPIYLSYFGHGM